MAENTLTLDGKGGVQVALGGDIIHWSTAEQGGAGEIFGILVAALVLFLTLGVVAMGLPLLNALFAMVVSLSLMAVVGTRLIDVVDWTPQLAAMIGIGVGIDYALLILNRFRLERGAGRDVRDATLVAIDTSGRAVLFAGIVVVIAMLGMLLLGISFLYGPAIGAALSVLFTMVRLADADAGDARQDRRPDQAGGQRRRAPTARPASPRAGAASSRAGRCRWRSSRSPCWSRSRCPRCTCAWPRATPAPTRRTTPRASPTTCSSRASGPASTRRCCSRSSCPRRATRRRCSRSATRSASRTGSPQVLPPQLNEAGDTATMIAYPTTTPQDERTDETVRTARDETLPPIAKATGARVSIGGTTASNLDFSQTIRDKLPLFIGVVVGLSLLLLAVVFRSLLIPVKAGIFNLLSIAGAFGVVTLIFQDGHLASLFGDATGPIESFLPIMVFAVVFGLSMDYEVFLVSRMHEEWVHTKDAHVRGAPRPGDDRPRGDGGGDHHDRGLRRLRDRQRAGAGDDGRRLRRRRSSSTRSSSGCCCCRR